MTLDRDDATSRMCGASFAAKNFVIIALDASASSNDDARSK
jgi:hypothetical protein